MSRGKPSVRIIKPRRGVRRFPAREFFRPYGLAYILTWVNAVWILNTVLGLVAFIWIAVVSVVCVERVYGLDRPKAIATVAIPVGVVVVLATMFLAVLGAAVLFGLGLAS